MKLISSILFKCLPAFFLVFSVLFFSENALAKVGVGIGAGEIRVEELVKPGGIYNLPAVRIFNTGTEVSTYGLGIAYHQDNPQLRPEKEWFTFKPSTFTIGPGESQKVEISMTIPVKTEPGDYFAFIEAGPVAKNEPGTSVGIAVASKLFFTVEHANLFAAVMYRTNAFFDTYSPWSWILLAIVALIIVVLILKRFFSFKIDLKKK